MIRLGLLVAAVVLVADQVTKWVILDLVMAPPRTIEVTPFFNLVMVWNRGVSFGMFANEADMMRWVLIAVAAAITVVMLVWLKRADRGFVAVALGLIIGGAVGNVVDRLRFGAVADFLDLHLMGYHWPAFNVADAGITIGVALLVIDSLFGRRGAEEAAE
ncbi:MAG TPA: signal peptidase II [Alphaproteobacteria bacterium]|nr:signal peptidase II [Alphaproteobacteria bacterium]